LEDSLGEIGAPEAVEVLGHIAQTDEDPIVRRLASEATTKIEAHHTPMNAQSNTRQNPSLRPRRHPERGRVGITSAEDCHGVAAYRSAHEATLAWRSVSPASHQFPSML
jgi:hypothetical protein